MRQIKGMDKIKTLGALKKSGYKPQSIKEELRNNLIKKIQAKESIFPGIVGFEDTVLPDLERAILSKHNVLFLGLRGQAKTKMARLLVNLLDEEIPVVEGSELNDDPLNPISLYAKNLIAEKGDNTPISWLSKEDRYVEKLATPDVSIADLVGDVDPIKAATLKLPYSDERVIHFGLIPRSHRCIFVINELPDLQARIQVSLFNILQEGDMQIRGFKLRLPLEIQFVFTANPEDYTNRGSIITPLKDRISSQILTHYPKNIEIARNITWQEAKIPKAQESISLPEIHKDILERISFVARESEYIDEKSGVSARLSISALENLLSTSERRMLLNKEAKTNSRLTDFWGVVPAITGKVELVYEGEQEGPYGVALNLLGKAIKEEFLNHFPHPENLKKGEQKDPYGTIRAWFGAGNTIDLINDSSTKEFKKKLESVAGLEKLAKQSGAKGDDLHAYMELILHGLTEFEVLTKDSLENGLKIRDVLADMFGDDMFGDN